MLPCIILLYKIGDAHHLTMKAILAIADSKDVAITPPEAINTTTSTLRDTSTQSTNGKRKNHSAATNGDDTKGTKLMPSASTKRSRQASSSPSPTVQPNDVVTVHTRQLIDQILVWCCDIAGNKVTSLSISHLGDHFIYLLEYR
jgi:hypothetical protein